MSDATGPRLEIPSMFISLFCDKLAGLLGVSECYLHGMHVRTSMMCVMTIPMTSYQASALIEIFKIS